jgi:hypothetical protein
MIDRFLVWFDELLDSSAFALFTVALILVVCCAMLAAIGVLLLRPAA